MSELYCKRSLGGAARVIGALADPILGLFAGVARGHEFFPPVVRALDEHSSKHVLCFW